METLSKDRISHWEDVIYKLSSRKNETEQLLVHRIKALKTLKEIKYPVHKGVDFSLFEPLSVDVEEEKKKKALPNFLKELEKDEVSPFVFQEGELVSGSLPKDLKEKGVLLETVDVAARDHREIFFDKFGKVVTPDFHPFAIFNYALRTDGIFLYIPKETRVAVPLYILNDLTGGLMTKLPYFLLVVDEGAHVEVLYELYSDPVVEQRVLEVTEVYIGPGAKVKLELLQDLPESANVASVRKSLQDKESYLKETSIWFGGVNSYSFWVNQLAGEGSRVEEQILHFASDEEKYDFFYKAHHTGRRTESDILAKGVLMGKARSLFDGMVRVEKSAQLTNSLLKDQSLLLEPGPVAKSIPGLEILANDVKVTHSASLSEIGDDEIFYLETRGIDRFGALELIVGGFLNTGLESIPFQPVRERVFELVRNRIRTLK